MMHPFILEKQSFIISQTGALSFIAHLESVKKLSKELFK